MTFFQLLTGRIIENLQNETFKYLDEVKNSTEVILNDMVKEVKDQIEIIVNEASTKWKEQKSLKKQMKTANNEFVKSIENTEKSYMKKTLDCWTETKAALQVSLDEIKKKLGTHVDILEEYLTNILKLIEDLVMKTISTIQDLSKSAQQNLLCDECCDQIIKK